MERSKSKPEIFFPPDKIVESSEDPMKKLEAIDELDDEDQDQILIKKMLEEQGETDLA